MDIELKSTRCTRPAKSCCQIQELSYYYSQSKSLRVPTSIFILLKPIGGQPGLILFLSKMPMSALRLVTSELTLMQFIWFIGLKLSHWLPVTHFIRTILFQTQLNLTSFNLLIDSAEKALYFLHLRLERMVSSMATLLCIAALIAGSYSSSVVAEWRGSFEDNFSIMWSEDHFKTSEDGQIWYLSLDKETGTHTS